MPAAGRLLGQTGTVPHHPFDQGVGHGEAGCGPASTLAQGVPAEAPCHPQPAQQQAHLEPAPGTGPQDKRGHRHFDPGQQAEQPAAQGQRFNRLGLQHPSKKLPRPLMAHLLWGEAQGTRQ